MTRRVPLKLYWCWTDDHDEDWFCVARSAREARRHHERAEGYDRGDAQSALVMALPESLQDDRFAGWPSRRLLLACGAQIERWDTPRVVVIEGRRYAEGMLEHQVLLVTDDLAERDGRGRPNKTERTRMS
jgi:hypothetical protein